MRKALAVAALALIALLAGAILTLDWLAAAAIERGAAAATGLPTSVEGASIRPLAGRFGVRGVEIANPPGFDSPVFFAMTDLELALPLGALLDDPIRIPELVIDGVELTLERKGITTNAGAILERLDASGEAEGSSGPGLVIEELVIRNVRANLRLIPGAEAAISVSIPEIRLTRVGGGREGAVEIAEVVRLVIGHTVRAVTARRDLLPSDLRAELLRGFGLSGTRERGSALRESGEAAARRALGRLLGGDD